jgi:hypothetical protein
MCHSQWRRDAYTDAYSYGHGDCNGYGYGNCHTQAYAYAAGGTLTEAAPDSAAPPVRPGD